MTKFKFNPQSHYKINAFTLTLSVIFGLIFCLIFRSILPLIIFAVLSQADWLKDFFVRLVHKDDVNAIKRLTNSAHLADEGDKYTIGRYRAAPMFQIENRSNYKLLYIDSNGISNSTKLDQLAQDVAAAYHSSAYLVKIDNGKAVYRIDAEGERKSHVKETDF